MKQDAPSDLMDLILLRLHTWPCGLCDAKTPGNYVPWKPKVILGDDYSRKDIVSRALRRLELRKLIRRARSRTAPRQQKTFGVALTEAGRMRAAMLLALRSETAATPDSACA